MNAIVILKRFDTFLKKAEIELATMKLANGATIEASEFVEGAEVHLLTDDGKVPLPVGEYELEDGKILVVGEVGKIGKIHMESIPEAEEEGYKDGIADAKEDIREDVDSTNLTDEAQETDLAEHPEKDKKEEMEYVSKEEFESKIEEIKEMVSKVEAKLNEGKEEDGAFVVKEELQETQLFKHNPNADTKQRKFKLGENRKANSTMDRIMERISQINN